MSAHTHIRLTGDLQRFVWRALRSVDGMTTGSLVSISGGDGGSQATQVRTYLRALSRAEIVYGRRCADGEMAWKLACDLGPQAPTYRRRAGDPINHSNTGQELPCANNSRKPLDKENKNAVTRHSIDHPRSYGLREDGQIRILEKEATSFIANLNTWARWAKVLERRPIATDAPRDAVGEGTVDAFRRAECL